MKNGTMNIMRNRQTGMSMYLHHHYSKELAKKITEEGRKNPSDMEEYFRCLNDPSYFFHKYYKIKKKDDDDFESQNYEEWIEE